VSPNYPNPFNASTLIEYGLPESGPVKVEIFDILGRKIQTLVNETQAAGYHQVIFGTAKICHLEHTSTEFRQGEEPD
jgi:hypothetical protein